MEAESGEWVRLNKVWRYLYWLDQLTPEISSHFGDHPFVCLRDGRAVSPEHLQSFRNRFESLFSELAATVPTSITESVEDGVSVSQKTNGCEANPNRKVFRCPFCRYELEGTLPMVCSKCNTGIPEDARHVSLRWPEHKNKSPDKSEGNDGRHIADS